jgi:hypothetical protein
VLQNFIVLSVVPPPKANYSFAMGTRLKLSQLLYARRMNVLNFEVIKLLSLPPEANWVPSHDYFKPQTSWVWPSNLSIILFALLTSWLILLVSRLRMKGCIIIPWHRRNSSFVSHKIYQWSELFCVLKLNKIISESNGEAWN